LKSKAILALIIVSLLSLGFFPGCGGGGDGGGGGDSGIGSVTGTVIDNNDIPIQGATSSITTPDTGSRAVHSGVTDSLGDFTISNVPAGTWTLVISHSNYQVLNVEVVVNSGQTTEVPYNQTILSAGASGEVAGTVTDNSNNLPLEGVNISVGTSTGVSGVNGYTISGVTAGTQTITAEISGYQDYVSTVEVIAGQTITHNIAMTPAEVPPPEPGKGHVSGQVNDVNGNGLSGVTGTIVEKSRSVITSTTNSTGKYTLQNVEPGVQIVTLTKTGYEEANVEVNVVEGQTVTASLVTLGGEPPAGTTVICSVPRTTESQVGQGSIKATVSDSGNYVTFESNEHLLAIHISNSRHIYLYQRSSGTVSMVDKAPNGLEGNDGQNQCDTQNGGVSGNGNFVVFDSDAINLLGEGLDTNDARDIFLFNVSDAAIRRVTVDSTNQLLGGMVTPFGGGNKIGADSQNPTINLDGTYVAYESVADNLVVAGHYSQNHAVANGIYNTNIYRAKINSGRSIETVMVSQRKVGGECNPADWGGVHRISEKPYISRDGRFIVYQSNAFQGAGFIGTSGQGALTDTTGARDALNDRDIALCDMSKEISDRNTLASMNLGSLIQPSGISPCTVSSVSNDGKKVVFQCADTGLWEMNDGKSDVWLKNMESGQLSLLTFTNSGTRGDSKNGRISSDGAYVVFDSGSDGLVSNDTNHSTDCFVKDLQTGTVVRVNLSGNSEQTEPTPLGSIRPYISGDNKYVVFETDAKNLTSNVFFATGVYDVYLRRWR